MSGSRARTVSFTVSGVTEPDATGLSPAAIGPDDAPPHAGQVVRRVLLRRNIVIDAETAQLVAAAVQAALQAGAPSRPSGRARVFPPRIASRCPDTGFALARWSSSAVLPTPGSPHTELAGVLSSRLACTR